MSSPLVSIIIPVYNTAAYLRECFDSILAQTYTNYEVVVVDDGSTDDSGAICDEYAERDSRFVVIHKQNGGVSTARNTGLDAATGDYIGFVDSDDMMLPGMFEEYVRVAEKTGADLVESLGFLTEGEKANNSDNARIYEFNNEDARREFFTIGKIRPSVCLAFIKRDVVKDIRFSDEIHHWEDYTFLARVIARTDVAAVTTNIYYIYRDREGSATNQGLNEKHMSSLLIYDYLDKYDVMITRQERYDVRSMFIAGVFCDYVFDTNPNNSYKAIIRKNIWQHLGPICRSRSINKSRKIAMTCFLISEVIAVKAVRKHHEKMLSQNAKNILR